MKILIQSLTVFLFCIRISGILTAAFYDIQQMDLISLFIRSDRFIEGNLAGSFFLCPQIHQQFIVDTSGSIGSQPVSFVLVEGRHRLDQPDGSDRQKIIQILMDPLVFFYHVRHQPQIPLDQNIFCRFIALLIRLQVCFLFCCGKRLLEWFHGCAPQKGDLSLSYVIKEKIVLFQVSFFHSGFL